MSLFQSWLQRLRDEQWDLAQLRRAVQNRSWLNASLWLGVVIGLVLGLWIGWGLWPVSWTGASLSDLRTDARADYMSAVADAYAMSNTPEAAAIAQQRLSLLGNSDLSQEFAAAIVYYRDSQVVDKPERINNLGRLASALGLSSPAVAGADQPTAGGAVTEPTLPVQTTTAGENAVNTGNDTSATAADTTQSSGSSWLNWLLGLLIAMMLIAGAFYLYLLIRPLRPRYQTAAYGEPLDDATIDARLDEMGDATLRRRTQMYGMEEPEDDFSQATGGRERGVRTEPTSGYGRAAGVSSHSVGNDTSMYQRPKTDDYEFDEEPDDSIAAQRFASSQSAGRTQVWPPRNEAKYDEEQALDDDFIDDVDELDDVDEVAPHAEPTRPMAASRLTPPVESNTDTGQRRDNAVDAVRAAAATDARSGFAGRTSKLKLLEKYTAHYQAGIPNYEEKHPILDVSTNRYIGEMGMGVSTKNALFQNDPAQAIALEVWLFDKADDRNMGAPTRILLSEYAIDHNLEQAFLKERQDDPRPFTAQPGVRFQLEGHSLVLDCEITEAVYAKNGQNRGVFQSVQVEMAVLQKAG
ncbi:MAG: hypothetical protein NT075_21435 [Chloroflexi bacterium]|nr:hypothetical protein [Chloroflexota bacterium]